MRGRVGGPQLRLFVRTHSGPNWTVREDLPLELPVAGEFGFGGSGLGIDASGDTIAAHVYANHGPDPDVGPSEVHVFKRSAGVYSKVAALTPGAWRVHAADQFLRRCASQSAATAARSQWAIRGTTASAPGHVPRRSMRAARAPEPSISTASTTPGGWSTWSSQTTTPPRRPKLSLASWRSATTGMTLIVGEGVEDGSCRWHRRRLDRPGHRQVRSGLDVLKDASPPPGPAAGGRVATDGSRRASTRIAVHRRELELFVTHQAHTPAIVLR